MMQTHLPSAYSKEGGWPVNAPTSRHDPHDAEAPFATKVSERRRCPPSTAGKKTLQERRKGKPLKLNIHTVAKMHTGLTEAHHAQ